MSQSIENQKGRKNKAFSAIKTDLEEKERQKKKTRSNEVIHTAGAVTKPRLYFAINTNVEEVCYVDVQRNMAVTLGERDVKADVKAKNKYNSLTDKLGFNYQNFSVGGTGEELLF